MAKRKHKAVHQHCLSRGDHSLKNYFKVPNAIFNRGLSTGALVTLMYLLLHKEPEKESEISAETIADSIGKKLRSVNSYLHELDSKGMYYHFSNLVMNGNFFMMPKAIFDLGLSMGAVATYAYLMRSENRERYQCWPSMRKIGKHIGKTRKSVMAYVRELEEKQLIYSEHTTVTGKDGIPRNGNLCYTLRNIEDAKRYHYEQQVLENERRAAQSRAF